MTHSFVRSYRRVDANGGASVFSPLPHRRRCPVAAVQLDCTGTTSRIESHGARLVVSTAMRCDALIEFSRHSHSPQWLIVELHRARCRAAPLTHPSLCPLALEFRQPLRLSHESQPPHLFLSHDSSIDPRAHGGRMAALRGGRRVARLPAALRLLSAPPTVAPLPCAHALAARAHLSPPRRRSRATREFHGRVRALREPRQNRPARTGRAPHRRWTGGRLSRSDSQPTGGGWR